MSNRTEIAALAKRLQTERGYGPLASEALSRAWYGLATDRGWTVEQVVTLALDAAIAGVLPDEVRRVTELTGRIITLAPPSAPKKVAVRKSATAPASLKVSHE